MKILIPGGAGYIGSHMVRLLQAHNHEVVVLDNFSTGHRWATENVEIVEADLLDFEQVNKTFINYSFDGVIHFAAKSIVSESVIDPGIYYRNNVVGTLNLLTAMIDNDVENLIFSSTAAVFGNPLEKMINEAHQKKPINPYGASKLAVENILQEFSKAYNLNYIIFRYFNAAGADPSGSIGEAHDPETHLIPNIFKAILAKNDQYLNIYGDNYDTYDGTCIRDYIHVNDISRSHLLGLEWLIQNKTSEDFNLGNGSGFSVKEVINSVEKILNQEIKYEVSERREGDPAILVADSTKAQNILNWKPEYSSIISILETAYNWHKRNVF